MEAAAEDICNIASAVGAIDAKRFYALKLIEGDSKLELNLSADEEKKIAERIGELEKFYDDDGEGIITEARYSAITDIISGNYKPGKRGQTTSDKVDAIVTNRILALPIFVIIMTAVYYISAKVVGGPVTDWVNDTLLGEYVAGAIDHVVDSLNTAPRLHSSSWTALSPVSALS